MTIGYARTSTTDQVAGLDAQIKLLKEAGCEKLYIEQVSSVGSREQMNIALDYIREGDTLVVTKIDRLARSVRDLLAIINRLEDKDVGLRVLSMGMDTKTPTGKLMLNVLGAVAQFEREMMLERQRDGIAKAKKDGKYKGRQPLPDDKKRSAVFLVESGLSKKHVAEQLGIGLASVYRILDEHKATDKQA